jgi:hypothetical protein
MCPILFFDMFDLCMCFVCVIAAMIFQVSLCCIRYFVVFLIVYISVCFAFFVIGYVFNLFNMYLMLDW